MHRPNRDGVVGVNLKAAVASPACQHPGSSALHRTQTCFFLHLFARLHCGRDFGGLWYQIFNERAPTRFLR
jgi:hypothetical protein